MMGCSEHGNENLSPTVRGELFDCLNNCRFLKKSSIPWGRCFIHHATSLVPIMYYEETREYECHLGVRPLSYFRVSKTDLRLCFMF